MKVRIKSRETDLCLNAEPEPELWMSDGELGSWGGGGDSVRVKMGFRGF